MRITRLRRQNTPRLSHYRLPAAVYSRCWWVVCGVCGFDESKVQNIRDQNKTLVAPLPGYNMPPNFYMKLRRYVAFDTQLKGTHFSRQLARTQRGRDAVGSSEHTESGEWMMS